ncbi:hypothetical protein Pelo_4383 [Pelomyxa schiedti]|nr:hypothetical protein Pelo_4383 [Pelomyxa schiedti]
MRFKASIVGVGILNGMCDCVRKVKKQGAVAMLISPFQKTLCMLVDEPLVKVWVQAEIGSVLNLELCDSAAKYNRVVFDVNPSSIKSALSFFSKEEKIYLNLSKDPTGKEILLFHNNNRRTWVPITPYSVDVANTLQMFDLPDHPAKTQLYDPSHMKVLLKNYKKRCTGPVTLRLFGHENMFCFTNNERNATIWCQTIGCNWGAEKPVTTSVSLKTMNAAFFGSCLHPTNSTLHLGQKMGLTLILRTSCSLIAYKVPHCYSPTDDSIYSHKFGTQSEI